MISIFQLLRPKNRNHDSSILDYYIYKTQQMKNRYHDSSILNYCIYKTTKQMKNRYHDSSTKDFHIYKTTMSPKNRNDSDLEAKTSERWGCFASAITLSVCPCSNRQLMSLVQYKRSCKKKKVINMHLLKCDIFLR